MQTENKAPAYVPSRLNFLINSYEQTYIGRKGSVFPKRYCGELEQKLMESLAVGVARYAVETYLRWNARQVKAALTKDVLIKLKLYPAIMTWIKFPPEYADKALNEEDRIRYLAHLMYPKEIRISLTERTLNKYDELVTGKIPHLSSTWMSNADGQKKFEIILRQLVYELPRFYNKGELYDFIFSKEANDFLVKRKIAYFARTLHQSIPAAYHNALPDNMRSDFLYHFHMWEKSAKDSPVGSAEKE